jgi:uncharacterized membrane protein YphA (DoxX/SURF4 family)
MEMAKTILQVVIALGIYNVWLVRSGKPTDWRGGAAQNLQEEFEAYGLPKWAMGLVGFLKLLFATLLLLGIWYSPVVRPAAVGMLILMVGAVAMHVKVGDPPKRSLPAFTMLVLSAIVAFG